MPRNRNALYSLRRPKCRPSWHKLNLYNIDKMRSPFKSMMTYFQQKWYAKKVTRAYHGDTLKEKQWRRMFRPDMRSVISMNESYLGRNDGSDLSAGRGAGRTQDDAGFGSDASVDERKQARPRKRTPYMNMIYHQLERRLDVAIWRALFASSTKQARQICVHGGVTVNGKKMIYPGYQLNPGDMFQVDVERVMYATGAAKDYFDARSTRQERRRGFAISPRSKPTPKENDIEASTEEAEIEDEVEPDSAEAESSDASTFNQSKNRLQSWLDAAKLSLQEPRTKDESAARKRGLREFTRTVRKELGSKASWNTPIDEQIAQMAEKLSLDEGAAKDESADATPSASRALTQTLQNDQERMLQQALQQMRENPLDYSKGYKTPWEPRPYMSAFAFIPRYLEVHAPICAAVYLRHPVARAGLGEVPTPFAEATNGLAFNWYLRRR